MRVFFIVVVTVLSQVSCRHPDGQSLRGSSSDTSETDFFADDAPRVKKSKTNWSLSTSKNTVKMSKNSGVYYIPVEINGTTMRFIFDTGASIISISETEALYLYKQGTLKEEDFLGDTNFQDATGTLSQGTRILLKTVKLGNKTLYDVEASVVHNSNAPLLFGQSALAQFGKVSIDYDRNEITFE